jgi:hydrogenase maturation protein HypF
MGSEGPVAVEVRSAALRVRVSGEVQGLGVRPAIARWAGALGLAGRVWNANEGVLVHVEGDPTCLRTFLAGLSERIPHGTGSLQLAAEDEAVEGLAEFRVEPTARTGPLRTPVPLDRATCADCLRDAQDANEPRRRAYAFVSCASCGPRYSVIRAMPYDRSATSMSEFPLCGECRREYESPRDRRFYAETTACAACGPRIWAVDARGRSAGPEWRSAAVAALAGGRIVAVRGVGGYQLLCDATRADAVARLRERKRRPTKPLAVLVESPSAADRLARLDADERGALADPANPIVILRARSDSPVCASAVHPGLRDVGVMAPTTVLHWLLVRDLGRPLVCTSGNVEGAPLEHEPSSAQRRLGEIADLFLHHDRQIVHPIDDAVVRCIAGRRTTLRLGRGFGPLPLEAGAASTPALAVGGQMKSAVAWSNGAQTALSPHIGDLDELGTLERWRRQWDLWRELYGVEPREIYCDAHPDYASTLYAHSCGLPVREIQHHHAHIAAAMIEAGLGDREVLGVAWDGTGYGPDGTVWGGEFLRTRLEGFERAARLRPFRLLGGEAAVRDPSRAAASVLLEAFGESAGELSWLLDPNRLRQAIVLRRCSAVCPWTSSAGRLFDAAAWLLLGDGAAGFDGRPAMLLESLADRSDEGWYSLRIERRSGSGLLELDWRPLVVELTMDLRRGVSPAAIAMRFHRGLAKSIVEVWGRWRQSPLVLSGGVFQNRLLVELVCEEFERAGGSTGRGGRLHWGGAIPPNDGGLAAGQLAVGLATSKRRAGRHGRG